MCRLIPMILMYVIKKEILKVFYLNNKFSLDFNFRNICKNCFYYTLNTACSAYESDIYLKGY